MRLSLFICLAIVFSHSCQAQIDPLRVTIIRDSFGIPHIHGGTDAEAEYGLSWAQCEDDFKDVQYNLLAAKGRLGEVLGKEGVLFDFGLKFLSIDTLVASKYDKDLSPSFRKIVEAYVQGINDYAALHPDEVLLRDALPVTPQDVIKGYTLNLSLMAGVGMALKAIKEDRIEEFMKPNEIGSNAMAIAPSRTTDNKTWLLVNSHQPLEGRFAWWEAHVMSDEGWNMIGGLFPGGMSVFVGSNPDLGWAHTTNYNTWGDIYKLRVKGSKYQYDGQWKTFTSRKIRLKLKLGGVMLSVTKKILSCEYGPVFKTKEGHFAIRFPAYMDIRAAEQWYKMNKSHNWQEFESAIKMEAIPHFNIIYADKAGNIFYQSGGMYPVRNKRLNWHLPITANTSEYKWTGLIPYKDKPFVFNPTCGFVYNANQTPLRISGDECNWSGDFPGLQRFEYNRGERFGELLKSHVGRFSWDAFLRIKFDMEYSPQGSYAAKFSTLFNISETKYPDLSDAMHKIKNWNHQGGTDNKDAGLVMLAHYRLMKKFKGPFAFLMIRDKILPEQDAAAALRWAQKFMITYHGTIDKPLGEVQQYIRGDVTMPAEGLYEVPRAADAKLYDKKKGVMRIESGDGYIQVGRFGGNGAELESISPYGSSAHPDSRHYTDQMALFCKHKFRNLTFDMEAIRQSAELIYHPKGTDYNLSTRKSINPVSKK